MKVWLLSIGEPLPCDGKGDRLWRSGLLASALMQKGHEVTWWTSTFHHKEKRQRATEDRSWVFRDRCEVRMLHARGYRKNISVGRFLNHRELAQKFRRAARQSATPDLIFCCLPTLDFCTAAVDYGRDFDVPVVLDVRDLWPDIFADIVPAALNPLAHFALLPLQKKAHDACARADALTGITNDFVDWGVAKACRTRNELDRAFPMGYADVAPNTEEIAKAKSFWRQHGVDEANGEFILCFFGTLNRHFEHDTVMQAAAKLAESGKRPIRFVICGDGPTAPLWSNLSKSLSNVILPGWVNAAQIWTLMRMSGAALAPYASTHDFMRSLPNKSIEYLSAGLPVLSSLQGTLAKLLLQDQCGLTYGNNQAGELVGIAIRLYDDPSLRKAMSENADRLYRKQFVAEAVYSDMADHLLQVAAKRNASKYAA